MSNSKWLALKNWFYQFIADRIPETSKRFVLYELESRVILTDLKKFDSGD